jgi:hypothetical protein
MVVLRCPYCSGRHVQLDLGCVRCENCRSIAAHPIRHPDVPAQFYAKYSDTYHGGGRVEKAKRRQMQYARRYAEVTLPLLPAGGPLCDVGSSNSPYPAYMAARGCSVVSADMCVSTVPAPGVEYMTIDLNANVRSSGSHRNCDLVTAFAVLEYTVDFSHWFRRLLELVRPGGHFVGTIPIISRFDRSVLGRSPWFYPAEHLKSLVKWGSCVVKRTPIVDVRTSLLEVNSPRWGGRYALSAVQAVAGLVIRAVFASFASRLASSRMSKCVEIVAFDCAKPEAP